MLRRHRETESHLTERVMTRSPTDIREVIEFPKMPINRSQQRGEVDLHAFQMSGLGERMWLEIANTLKLAKEVVVFTGAGISAESGIPTFRDGATGL